MGKRGGGGGGENGGGGGWKNGEEGEERQDPAVTHDANGAQHVRYNLHHVWPSATYHTTSQGIEIFCIITK